MKKLLTILLSVAMVLCMMPSMAFATVADTDVAKIDNTGYATLQAAVNDANDGDEIVLLNNVSEQITINNGKTMTINLDGHTISNTTKTIILEHGNLTLTGEGTVTETEDNGYSAIMVYGSTNTSDKDYSLLTVGEQVTLGGWAGIFIDKNSDEKACGVKINFNGRIVSPAENTSTPGNAFFINGNIQEKTNSPEITIGENAVINATGVDSCAIYAAGYAKWTINGGQFTGDGCVEAKAGELEINGGSFYSTNGSTSQEPNGNGTSSVGYGLAVVNNKAYAGQPVVTINGGTFNSPIAVLDDDDNPDNNTATLSISGGKFINDIKPYKAEGKNEYLTENNKYFTVSASEPAHSGGNNTWTLNPETGIYEESYVAPVLPPTGGGSVTPTDPVTNTGTSDTDNATTNADISKDTTSKTETTTETKLDGTTTTTTTTVSNETANKIVDKAVEHQSAEVVLDTTTKAVTTAPEAGDKTEVVLPAETMQTLAEKTTADVTIKSDVAEVTLDAKAVEAVAEQTAASKTETVTLVVENTKNEADEMHFELTLVTESGKVSDFGGGKARVTVSLNPALKAVENLICVYIDDNGVYHKVEGTKNADGTYTFVTGHFSSYAIMAADEADKVLEAQKTDRLIAGVQATTIKASSTAAPGYIRVKWNKSYGYKMDYFEVYKAKSKAELKASKKPYFETKSGTWKSYKNAKGLKKGTKYFYRVRGVREINGVKYYTNFSTMAYRYAK